MSNLSGIPVLTVHQGGRPDTVDYTGYLRLPELLRLQSPMSRPRHPDESFFIVTHQAIELWFTVLIDSIRRARSEMSAGRWLAAAELTRRGGAVVACVRAQTSALQAMPFTAFHAFRGFLGTASGLQSVQFREVEVLAGLRSPEYLQGLRRIAGGLLPPAVARALAEPSLAEVHQATARAAGVHDWADFYRRHGAGHPLYLLSEAMAEFDQAWFGWRADHLALLERMLGSAVTGTAGTKPSYLYGTLRQRFFPYLWDARSALLTGGPSRSAAAA